MGTSDKRSRTKYTPEQLAELERLFCKTQYPDTLSMEELADKLNVSTEKISIWFQNRRSKFKRQSKDTHMSWMRKQIFNRENIPQPCVPKTDDKRHVLSPPDRSYHRQESSPAEKPSSNLHYLPPLPSYMDSVLDLSILPSQTSSCGQPSPPGYIDSQQDHFRFHPSFPTKSLLISHLMTEQQTGSTPAQPIFPAPQFSSCMYNSSFPGMYYYPPNINVSQMTNLVATQSTVM